MKYLEILQQSIYPLLQYFTLFNNIFKILRAEVVNQKQLPSLEFLTLLNGVTPKGDQDIIIFTIQFNLISKIEQNLIETAKKLMNQNKYYIAFVTFDNLTYVKHLIRSQYYQINEMNIFYDKFNVFYSFMKFLNQTKIITVFQFTIQGQRNDYQSSSVFDKSTSELISSQMKEILEKKQKTTGWDKEKIYVLKWCGPLDECQILK